MQIYSSRMRLKEWEQANIWYQNKRQEIESKFTKGGSKMVNKESIINDFLNPEKSDEDAVTMFLLGQKV